ncbi:MAG TPA: penicillin-binding transpeptidase domain-containing protein, partial [Acidimicrobiales bacterium]
FAQAVLAEGPRRLAQMGKSLGLGHPDLPPYASLVLGTVDESVVQMTGAYSTFMDNGTYVPPRTILAVKDGQGQDVTDQLKLPSSHTVLTRAQTDVVTYCLRQVVLSGTGTGAAFGHPVAGKTGTTSNNTDAWFIGYSPQLTTAVWVGYPSGSRPMTGIYGLKQVTGGSLPADYFRRFMEQALSGSPALSFEAPGSLGTKALGEVAMTIDTSTTTTAPTSTTTPSSTTVAGSASTTTPSSPSTTSRRSTSTTAPPTSARAGAGPSG